MQTNIVFRENFDGHSQLLFIEWKEIKHSNLRRLSYLRIFFSQFFRCRLLELRCLYLWSQPFSGHLNWYPSLSSRELSTGPFGAIGIGFLEFRNVELAMIEDDELGSGVGTKANELDGGEFWAESDVGPTTTFHHVFDPSDFSRWERGDFPTEGDLLFKDCMMFVDLFQWIKFVVQSSLNFVSKNL